MAPENVGLEVNVTAARDESTTGHVQVAGTIPRHDGIVRFVHWSVALSTMALIVTGIFQLPVAKRYFIDQVPGLWWASDYGVTLVMHYLAAAVLLFGAALHLAYHGARRDRGILPRRGDLRESVHVMKSFLGLCEEPPCHKYLAEQRLAYVYIAGSLGLVIVTGALKVVKNLPGVELPNTLVNVSTHLHNLGLVLVLAGIAGHLFAFVIPANRPMLPSMFTGRVSATYARRRHKLWMEDLDRSDGPPGGDGPARQ
jgi:cytochrome b subunit of formate dehydrogenase